MVLLLHLDAIFRQGPQWALLHTQFMKERRKTHLIYRNELPIPYSRNADIHLSSLLRQVVKVLQISIHRNILIKVKVKLSLCLN